ncbi:magnesium transporter CorA family protein [Labrys monachus]|jgi:magnesium transporter|uniref:Magnesium transporter n=1 Tax=Labrys monachus TaxID=217067 RepID=A0ABU0FEE2_9HYPH|nr:magnesium transporter CorA family protein [Labrys monachus]MDQ0392978.1 magnesium transporter [Labrys monachus]
MMIVQRLVSAGSGDKLERHLIEPGEQLPADARWIDLLEPTREEDRHVEELLGIAVPTRDDMVGLEPSELLWTENRARYMIARLLVKPDAGEPEMAAVTFILTDNTLVTVRYSEPKSFDMFLNRATKPGGCGRTAEALLAGLVEAIINRAADMLQEAGSQIDAVSEAVFRETVRPGDRNASLQRTLRLLGRHGDFVSKARESFVSLERMLLFLSANFDADHVAPELREAIGTTLRDLQSLEEHASFQSNKIQFLLDATLGLVNLEQNNIIKLFSVMAVIFMPPTLVASVYGMNFEHMPELKWEYGYPMALGMMVIVAVAPYFLFRWKNWL